MVIWTATPFQWERISRLSGRAGVSGVKGHHRNMTSGRSSRRTPRSITLSAQAWDGIGRSLKLSTRELQIVRAIFDDRTEFAIAADLGVSPHTIHTHCGRLYKKLAVTDRTMLMLRVIDEFIALTVAPGSVLPPICAQHPAGR